MARLLGKIGQGHFEHAGDHDSDLTPTNYTRDASGAHDANAASFDAHHKGIDTQFSKVVHGEWVTLQIAASAFTFDATRSNYTLSSAAETHTNSIDGSILLSSGGEILSRVTTTGAANEWSLVGATLSIHGDITASGKTYQVHYLAGTSGGTGAAVIIRGGYVSGGPPTWQSVSTCRIPSGHKAIDPDTGALLTAGANYDCVLSASGALGLDTGSEAASTWYYLWLCSGASGTTGVWSASATAPTLPAGYAVNKARVGGAWRNNAGSDLLRAWHVVSAGRTVVTQAAPVTAQSGSVGAAATLVDLAAMVPPGATRVYMQMVLMAWNDTVNQSETMYALAYASASPTIEFALRCTVFHPTAVENLMCSAEGMIPLPTAQTIWAANVTSGGTPTWSSLAWDVLGWESA